MAIISQAGTLLSGAGGVGGGGKVFQHFASKLKICVDFNIQELLLNRKHKDRQCIIQVFFSTVDNFWVDYFAKRSVFTHSQKNITNAVFVLYRTCIFTGAGTAADVWLFV